MDLTIIPPAAILTAWRHLSNTLEHEIILIWLAKTKILMQRRHCTMSKTVLWSHRGAKEKWERNRGLQRTVVIEFDSGGGHSDGGGTNGDLLA